MKVNNEKFLGIANSVLEPVYFTSSVATCLLFPVTVGAGAINAETATRVTGLLFVGSLVIHLGSGFAKEAIDARIKEIESHDLK